MNKKSITIVGIFILVAVIGGCNKVENTSTSPTRLIVDLITGTDLSGEDESTTVFSDVLLEGSIINDNAKATLRAELLNPDPLYVNSHYESVIVDQVDVEYSRSDGLTVEGKDVPYRFSQKVNAVVEVGGTTELAFVIVQQNAKAESPLIELTNYPNQEHVLKLEAKCTFHSKDLAGNRLAAVSGTISVWFANFADPES